MSSPLVNTSEGKIHNDNSSDHSGESYEYAPPLVAANEWIHKNITNDVVGKFKRYFAGLFPILSWIYRYNLTWAIGGSYPELLISFLTIRSHRWYHRRRCRRTAEHVLCQNCDAPCSIWSLFIICRRFHLLFLRHFERRHNWTGRSDVAPNSPRHFCSSSRSPR